MKEQGSIQGFTINESGSFPVIEVALSHVEGAASSEILPTSEQASVCVYIKDTLICQLSGNGLGYLIVSTSSGTR